MGSPRGWGLLSGGALTLAGRHLILCCFLQHFVHGASFFIVIYSTLESRVSFVLFLQYFRGQGAVFVVFYDGFVGIWHRGITFCCYLQWSEPHGTDFAIIYSTFASFRREYVQSIINISKKCSLVCRHGRQPYPTLGLLSGGFIIGVPAFRVVPPMKGPKMTRFVNIFN